MESSLLNGQLGTGHSAQPAGLSFIFVFSLALFFSALLLFLVQPLIGKVLLPKLGGTPQVWTTCMVFFQAMLFAGYLHAHFSSKLLGIRRQALLHLGLAVLALVALPIGISSISSTPDSAQPILWLTKALLISVGAPLFVISATAPLLQKWVANTNHPSSSDPYFLYVASNAGSLLALLIYPTLIEPNFDLAEQRWWWSAGYAALVLIVVGCLVLFYRNYVSVPMQRNVESISRGKLDNVTRIRWLLLSFAPSSLLLGVTTFISADIAAVPLFWIVPLALYLLTFIIAFAKTPPISHEIALRSQAIFLALLTVLLLAPALSPLIVAFPVHLVAFFLTALVCHGELARSRPNSSHLTEFYLWL
jgi:hypothetical protein